MVRFKVEDISSFKNEIVFLQGQIKEQISDVYYEYESIIDKLYRAISDNESFTSTANEDLKAVIETIEHNDSVIEQKSLQIEKLRSQAENAESEAQAARASEQKTTPDGKPYTSNADRARSLEKSASEYNRQSGVLQAEINKIVSMNRRLKEYKYQIEKSISVLKQERSCLLDCKNHVADAKAAYDSSSKTANNRIHTAFQKTERAITTARSIVSDFYNIVGSSSFYDEIYFDDNGEYLHNLAGAVHIGSTCMNIEQRKLKSRIIDYGYAIRDDVSKDTRRYIGEYEKCISQVFDSLEHTGYCCGIMYEHIKQYLFIGS